MASLGRYAISRKVRSGPAVRGLGVALAAFLLGFSLVPPASAAAYKAGSLFTITPCRAVDTRHPPHAPAFASGQVRLYALHGVCGVAATAKAVAINVTITQPSGDGWLVIYRGNTSTATSFLSFQAGETLANNGIAHLASDGSGTLAVFAFVAGGGTVHVLLDVVGYFSEEPAPPASAEGMDYFAIDGCRALDTRLEPPALTLGTFDLSLRERCGLPLDAAVVALTITVLGPTHGGWVTLFPADQASPPMASTVNFNAGEPGLANSAIVPLASGLWADLSTAVHLNDLAGSVHVLLDVVGYFALPVEVGETGTPPPALQHPNLQRGFDPDKAFAVGELDNVNLLNGNLNVRIPLGQTYPVGGGLSYSFGLAYNSKIWDFDERWKLGVPYAEAVPSRLSNAGVGWVLTFGQLLDPDDVENTHRRSGEPAKWVYVSADGGEHAFYGTLTAYDGSAPAQPVPGFRYTRDGSYLRMREVGVTRHVELPDGTVQVFEQAAGKWRLKEIRNRFVNASGAAVNFVRFDYSVANQWTITDSHGRTHKVLFEADPSGAAPRRVRELQLAAFGDGVNPATATYRLSYLPAQVPRTCADSWPHNTASVPVSHLASIARPDGSVFSLESYTSNPATCHAHGLLRSIVLPTAGKIEWGYGTYTLPTPGCTYREQHKNSAGVKSRRLFDAAGGLDGEWLYQPLLSQPPTGNGFACDGLPPRTALPASEWLTNTVTTPLKDRSELYFSVWPGFEGIYSGSFSKSEYGLPFSRAYPDATGTRYLSSRTLDCDAAGNNCKLRRATYVRYEQDAFSCTAQTLEEDCFDTQRRPVSERLVDYDASGLNLVSSADTESSSFDGLGHYRQATTGGDFPGDNVRTSFTNFNEARGEYRLVNGAPAPGHTFTMWPTSAPWVLGTFTDTNIQHAGSQQSAEHCFDAATGFLKRTRGHRTGTSAQQDNDVLVEYRADDAGNVKSEISYGADTGPGLSDGAICSIGLPANQFWIERTYTCGSLATSQYMSASGAVMGGSLGFKSVNHEIHCPTGLIKTSRDPSLLAVSYEYDGLGRLTWVKPETGPPANGAWTSYVYGQASFSGHQLCGPAAITSPTVCIRSYENGDAGAGTPLAESQIIFDAFGRIAREHQKLPSGAWNVRETTYDGMGRRKTVSELGADASKVTRYEDSDAFGRPARIVPPDGTAHEVRLTYLGRLNVKTDTSIGACADAAGNTTEKRIDRDEVFDRFGRLHQVSEPSEPGDPCGAAPVGDTTTTYSYDAADRLTRVEIDADSPNVTQVREFTYDGLGFLRGEDHPEKSGSPLYGLYDVQYADYNARGHAGKKTDGPVELVFAYDRAERLTSVTHQGFTLKTFTWGTGTTPANRRLGKLSQAVRSNYPEGVGTGLPVTTVTETYTYGGRDGRVSQHQLAVSGVGSFTQSFAYDALGNVAAHTYPSCSFLGCSGAAPARTAALGYTAGWLTSVSTPARTYASEITYHPNGLVARARHGNGVDWQQDNDPDNLARPAHICRIAAANGSTCGQLGGELGPYRYDGAGNPIAVGGEKYRYDLVSRIRRGTLGGGQSQSYTYDGFGNLTSIVTAPVGPDPDPVLNVSGQTNRLSFIAYDAAGNQLAWDSYTYAYDPFNMMRSMTGAGNDWRYLYTADDERVLAKNQASGQSVYRLRDLAGRVVRQFTQQGTVWTWDKDYVYRGNQLLASEAPAPEGTRYVYADHLGTPRILLNATGGVVASHHYFPFGKEAFASADTEPLRFTGHERDFGQNAGAADDLDYMHARHCSPLTGRFVSVDPVGGTPRVPQSWNRYAYVLGNPLRFIDPYGLVANCGEIRQSGSGGYAAVFCGESINVISPSLLDVLQSSPIHLAHVALRGAPRPSFSLRGQLETGIASVRTYLQNRFESMAAEGHTTAALIDYLGLELLLPQGIGDLGLQLATAPLPAGRLGKVVNSSGGRASVRAILKTAEKWLGKGYKEIAPGVFRSADGTRQFRMTTSDLTNIRQGPHVNFESVAADGRTIVENTHVQIVDP